MKPSLHLLLLSALALLIALPATVTAAILPLTGLFAYTFNVNGDLQEASSMGETTSPYWWVNSGGRMPIVNGIGSTNLGNLPAENKWRKLYAANNPVDTDNGYHPQNIFRLVGKVKREDFRQQAYFRIEKDNLSSSPNRNSSNGILLFNRYHDSNNLYYVGLRVDGAAVVKKKMGGTYYTIASNKVFPGSYDKNSSPNLLPKNTWIGLRSEIKDNPDGSVSIKLFTDVGRKGVWTLALDAKDNGTSFGGRTIQGAAYTGIRTDFMDVSFDDFRLSDI